MKKIALILTLLLLFSGFSLAEGIDLNGMTFDELVELEIQVQKAIIEAQPYSPTVFYPGTYTVGEDFDPGFYLIVPIKQSDTKWDNDFYDVFVYSSKEAHDNRELAETWRSLHIDSPERFLLAEGNLVLLQNAVFSLIRL